MKKDKKINAVIIAPYRKPKRKRNHEEILKKINSDQNPEWTIHYFFKPHIGGIMYEAIRKEKKNG